jgi:hypothetical protein
VEMLCAKIILCSFVRPAMMSKENMTITITSCGVCVSVVQRLFI